MQKRLAADQWIWLAESMRNVKSADNAEIADGADIRAHRKHREYNADHAEIADGADIRAHRKHRNSQR